MNDFMRCYTCGTVLPQRSGGQCDMCNPHHAEPDTDDLGDSDEEDYDFSAKPIDYRGPDDDEDCGEPIVGSYILCHAREKGEDYAPPLQDHADASVRLDIDPENECPCGDPDCTAMFDLPENEADHHPPEPCESLNEKTHSKCGNVDENATRMRR